MSKLFEHCVALYELMDEKAEDFPDGRLYIGSLTTDFEELGIGGSYYTKVTSRLRSMGCVDQLRRGGGSKPSAWAIIEPPTKELFQASDATGFVHVQKKRTEFDALVQRLNDMSTRIKRLEEWARRNGANV